MAQRYGKPDGTLRGSLRQIELASIPVPVLVTLALLFAGLTSYGVFRYLSPQRGGGIEIVKADLGVKQAEKPGSSHESMAVAHEQPVASQPPEPPVIVHIVGEVNSPGVYRLEKEDRVNDALVAAGGPTQSADVSLVNLAQPVADGMKIRIPAQGEKPEDLVQAEQSAQGAGAVSAGDAKGAAGPVNINSASPAQLESVPGIGPKTAQAIVEERTKNGPFKRVEDICRVSGIGPKKFEQMKGSIRV